MLVRINPALRGPAVINLGCNEFGARGTNNSAMSAQSSARLTVDRKKAGRAERAVRRRQALICRDALNTLSKVSLAIVALDHNTCASDPA